jgi:DNA invertase Pin-like site-specific DNA recombinase
MRTAIYARVSTLIGQSPEMKLAELREYASRRGWEIYGEYVDSGISGSKESRPELNRLMSDVHLRRFDVVLCWKVDPIRALAQAPRQRTCRSRLVRCGLC